jgi:hypothetical protein
MRVLAVALVFMLLAACMGKPDAGPAPTSPAIADLSPLDKYSYRGTQCVELGLDVPVDAAKLQPYVPSKYKVREVQGKAVMAFAFARCDQMVGLGSSNPHQVIQVDVAVTLENGAYELALTTNDAAIAQNASRTAFPAIHAPTSTLLGYPLQGSDLISAHVKGGNFTIDVEATAARGPATGPAGGTYYHTGPNGTSRMVYDVALGTVGPATGKITVPTGSMLALIFGATRVDGAGFYASFSLGANITRLPN